MFLAHVQLFSQSSSIRDICICFKHFCTTGIFEHTEFSFKLVLSSAISKLYHYYYRLYHHYHTGYWIWIIPCVNFNRGDRPCCLNSGYGADITACHCVCVVWSVCDVSCRRQSSGSLSWRAASAVVSVLVQRQTEHRGSEMVT